MQDSHLPVALSKRVLGRNPGSVHLVVAFVDEQAKFGVDVPVRLRLSSEGAEPFQATDFADWAAVGFAHELADVSLTIDATDHQPRTKFVCSDLGWPS
jgi:hypothetical protein